MSNTIRHKRIYTDTSVPTSAILAAAGIPGTQNRIVKFSATALTSSSLFDDGTTVEMDSGKWFTGQSGESILDFGTTGSEYWSLSRDGSTAGSVDYTTGWAYGEATYAQLGFGTSNYFNANTNLISGQATDVTNISQFTFNKTGSFVFNSDNGTQDLTATGTATSMNFVFTTSAGTNGNFLISGVSGVSGTTRLFKVLDDTHSLQVGRRPVGDSICLWMDQASPDDNNYTLFSNGSVTIINSPTDIYFDVNSTAIMRLNTTSLVMLAGMAIEFDTSGGSKIGATTSQKLAFWGQTPIIQPASANQDAVADQTQTTLTNSTGYGLDTVMYDVDTLGVADPVKVNQNFGTTNAELDLIKADILAMKVFQNQIRLDLIASGLIKGAA